jgi:hypothetical protein
VGAFIQRHSGTGYIGLHGRLARELRAPGSGRNIPSVVEGCVDAMGAESAHRPVGDRRRITHDTRFDPASCNPDAFVAGKNSTPYSHSTKGAAISTVGPTIVTARSVVMVMVNTVSDISVLFTRKWLLETPSANRSLEDFPSHVAAFPPPGRGRFTADPRCRACSADSVCDDNYAPAGNQGQQQCREVKGVTGVAIMTRRMEMP